MSVKDREVPFSVTDWEGADLFAGIIELGFDERGGFVIAAWTTPRGKHSEPRGRYFTSLPISPLEYRRTHRDTGAAYRREPDRLVIWDDWGKPHTIAAPADVLDTLVAECIANEIPQAEGKGDAP